MAVSQAELERIIQKHVGDTRPQRNTPAEHSERDTVEALGDYLARNRSHRAHPLAVSWQRADMTLDQVRESAGLTSSDFQGLMADSLSILLNRRYDQGAADLRAVVTTVQVDDFRERSVEAVAAGQIPEIDPEDGSIPRLDVKLVDDTPIAGLREFAGMFKLSRKVWFTAGAAIESAVRQFAGRFVGIEHGLLAGALSTSSTIQTKTGSLDASGLNLASIALRRAAEVENSYENWPIAALIVPAELEQVAAKFRFDYGQSWSLVVSPWLAPGAFYCVAPPAVAGGIVRLRLRGASGPTVDYARVSADQARAFVIGLDSNVIIGNPLAVVKVSA